MNLRTLLILLVLACSGANAQAPNSAPPANPVITHYRAYAAALANDDIDTALSEAAKALEASEARDGDGGRTAVLAFNLAYLRVQHRQPAEAKAPAARALALSGTPQSGVDPIAARILNAHVALLMEAPDSRKALHDALLAAGEREDMDRGLVLDAASALGRSAMEAEAWRQAAFAWNLAGRRTIGDRDQSDYKRAAALTWEAGARLALKENELALGAINEAVQLMSRLAPETEGPEASGTEIALGATLAWRAAIRAKMWSEGEDPNADSYDFNRASTEGLAPVCQIKIRARPLPQYPRKERDAFSVGGVALRLQIDESGQVTGARLLAVAAGTDSAFGDVVMKVATKWHGQAAPNSPPGCRMRTDSHIQTVAFMLR